MSPEVEETKITHIVCVSTICDGRRNTYCHLGLIKLKNRQQKPIATPNKPIVTPYKLTASCNN